MIGPILILFSVFLFFMAYSTKEEGNRNIMIAVGVTCLLIGIMGISEYGY